MLIVFDYQALSFAFVVLVMVIVFALVMAEEEVLIMVIVSDYQFFWDIRINKNVERSEQH